MVTAAKYPRGSEWRKWDLQVQPIKSEWLGAVDTKAAEIKSATLEYLKSAVDRGISVVAITDHNCGVAIDAAIALIKEKSLDIVVLPGVEIDDQSGFQLLVVLNPDYLRRIGKTKWKEGVEHFLNNVCQISSPVITDKGVAESTKCELHSMMNKIWGEDIGIPVFAHVQSDKGLFKKTTAANRQKFFRAALEGKYRFMVDHKSDGQIEETAKILEGWGIDARVFPLIKTSDAHSASDVGSTFTWVKAELTYEGLKQIIYDPQSRIATQESEPPKPTNAITSIIFNVPTTATITIEQPDGKRKEEAFCFAGATGTYELSPYLNCFVGGRGSGKSTVLNFLGQHAKDPESAQAFWDRLGPSFASADKKIFSFEGVDTFEFIGQSEVEAFATNREAFTSAIYERADLLSEGSLSEHEVRLKAALGRLSNFKSTVEQIEQLKRTKVEREREKKLLDSSIQITKSEEYASLVGTITDKSNQKHRLETWRQKVQALRSTLSGISESGDDAGADNLVSSPTKQHGSADATDVAKGYIDAYASAISHIDTAHALLDEKHFEILAAKEQQLGDEIASHEGELSALLRTKGLSDENVLQAKSAPHRVVKLDDELARFQQRIDELELELAKYPEALKEVTKAKAAYESTITKAIKPLATTLEEQARENQGKDIKNIGLHYVFDADEAWRALVDEAYGYFAQRYRDGERQDFVKTYILEHKDAFAGERSSISELLEGESKSTGYLKFLRDVFGSDTGYSIFRIIRDKHLNDVAAHKRIQVLYDGKDIERASFGQKCTAVMVVLLLFGNYPLIIDEPEAHLDSSLIANYLVPLIKKKKPNRQIIFSTHNANFVINGDAEKIFVLINNTGTTTITEATVEDLGHRDELLKLEGGREAFRKRGEKLHI